MEYGWTGQEYLSFGRKGIVLRFGFVTYLPRLALHIQAINTGV